MIGTALALSGWLALLCGADPELSKPLPKLQRIDFSDDHPETWPRTNPPLEPVHRDEFERLWSSLLPVRANQPAVVLERAVYQASVVNDRLQGGTFTADVHRTKAPTAWLKWAPFNLALSDVRWQDGTAVFGADSQGQHWLLADRERRQLTGSWSRQGRRIGSQTEFQLEVPPAVSTTLALRIPRGLKLHCPDQTIPLDAGEPEGPWVTWRIDLGSHTRVTLVTRGAEDDAARTPVVTYRKQQSAELGEYHLRFQVSFAVEVLNTGTSALEFTLPKAVELYSVNYGVETPLPWTRVSEDGNRVRVRVTLPDSLQGELRTLRLEGLLSRRPNATVVIPQVELADAVFLGGRHTVTLLRPLQLTSIRMTGCREAAAATPTNDGDTYQFQQFLPDALMTLEVRRPTSQLSVQTLSAVTFRDEEWQQRTEMLWSTVTGSAFQVAIQIPKDWEVTDVDALTASGNVDPVNWDLHDDAEGRKLLQVEFLEAITPSTPRTVRLLTRQRRSMEARSLISPVPRAADAAVSENVLVLQGEGMYRVGLPAGPAMTATTPAALPDSWRAFPLWSTLMQEEERNPAVWCRVEGSELIAAMLALEQEPQPASVVAQTQVKRQAADFEETFDLVITPEHAQLFDRVLVYLNEAGGEIEWKVISPAENTLVGSRLPIEQHGLWNLPASGELWEIRLPQSSVTVWQLRGNRRRDASSPVRAGLVFVPQATRFQGRISVRESTASPTVNWNARGLRQIESSVSDGFFVHVWEYSRLSADLSGVTTSTAQQTVRMMVEGQLTSTLTAKATIDEIHELRLNLRGVTRPFTLTLPTEAEWVLAKIDGEVISADPARQLQVSAVASDEPQIVEWIYRTAPTNTGWSSRRRIPWPTGFPETVWTRFEWNLRAPVQTDIDASCSGLRSADPVPAVHWRQRLFGPLARRETSPLFLPWQRESWQQWLSPPVTPAAGTVAGQSQQFREGNTRRYLGPMPPTELLVDVVDRGHLQIVAWSTMIFGAVLVLGLRATRWALRDRLVALLITAMCGLSFFWSGPWVDVTGGAIVGMVVGGLLPRRWWQSPPEIHVESLGVPGGSTQSFVFPQPINVFVLCCVGGSMAFAMEAAQLTRGEVTIYVPVDSNGKPSQRLPFVYLAPEVLKQLRAMDPQREAVAPDMLIERADYRVTIGTEPRASFSVTYRILSPSHEAILCDLPLPSVTLSGPQSCLLDGQPAAVSALADKRGLRIPIPAVTQAVSAIHAVEFARHEITLDFDHPWRRSSTGGSCELSLPQTAWTRVEVQGLSASSDVQWEDVAGGWERSLDQRQASVDLGASDQFRMRWQERSAIENRPTQALRVTTAESLDVSAAAIEVRCRSTVTPLTGSFSGFSWDFPAGTNFQDLQIRPSGHAEITTLKNKTVRVDVDFYEPVHDAAVLDANFVFQHAPLQGEFSWRGITAVESAGIQLDRVQRYWAISSVPEIRVQPQSVENSGLVPVVAESVRDLFTGLTSDQSPQVLFQVGTDSPVAFRWTTQAPRRRLLLWQQRGEIVGSRLNWSVEADLECTTSPPAYSHTFYIDRRLQIDQISVRERGAERRLNWTESRPSGSPQTRVTLWLTDPCLETQRITLTAHMPLSTSDSLTLPNVRCEDADLIGGRWELQSTRDLRGTWQSLRGLKSLSSTDDRLDASQHWIFEQTETEPRAVLRLLPRGQNRVGHAMYLLYPGEAGLLQMRTRWEMPSSDMLSGMQFLVPRPWKLASTPAINGAKLDSLQESERGSVITLGTQPRRGRVMVDLVLQASRSDFTQRQIVFPQLSHDPGLITWIAEAVPTADVGMLDGLESSMPGDWPEWVAVELARGVDRTAGSWRTAVSQELPQEWPRSSGTATTTEPPVDWVEHRFWCEIAPHAAGLSRAWLERPVSSLMVTVPANVDLSGVEVDGRMVSPILVKSGGWEIAAEKGVPFREVVLYWRLSLEGETWPASWSAQVPLFKGLAKAPPVITVFPPPGRTFLHRTLWNRDAWVDRGLQRLKVLGDHLDLHGDEPDAPEIARHFQRLYESMAEKLSHHVNSVMRPGSVRADRWSATVSRMNQIAPMLVDQGPARASTELDDVLLDHPDADYQESLSDGRTNAAWLLPAGTMAIVFALLVVLIGYPLLILLARWKNIPWFMAHPQVLGAVAGIVWWLCLSPSLAGFALAVAALFSGLMGYRSTANAEA